MNSSLSSQLSAAVEKLQAAGRYRFLESNSTAQATQIIVDGNEYTNFCSNDYLGLCNHQSLKDAAIAATKTYGVGAGAAQLLSGRHQLHAELEAQLAAFSGYEAALLFSSGYLANLGLISALVSRHDVVHQDRLNHASLIDAVKLSGATSKRYRHNDMTDLEASLSAFTDRRQWIVTDSVFSMDGDIALLPELSELAKKYKANLIVDDAHGFGVLADGYGVRRFYDLSTEQLPITMITFGKALGTQGAAVLGSQQLIDYLIQVCRTYIYDTATAPAITAATLSALDLVSREQGLHSRLKQNIHTFKKLCKKAEIETSNSITPIQPLILGEDQRAVKAAQFLREQGFYLRAIRPPTVPAGQARLRICLSSAHETTNIENLVYAIAEFFANDKKENG